MKWKKFVHKAILLVTIAVIGIPSYSAQAKVEEEFLIVLPEEEQPEEEQPVQEQPVQEQPVQEQPVQEQPVQEQPVQQQPIQQQPIQQQPVQQQPVQQQPVQQQQPKKETTPTPEPTPTVEPSPTATPTPEITINEGEAIVNEEDEIPKELVDSQWIEKGNTAVRKFDVGKDITRLELFHTKSCTEPEISFKDSTGANITTEDECITLIPDNELEYSDLVYDIIYIKNPQNIGEWSISVKKSKDVKELFLLLSKVPQEWQMERYFKTQPEKLLCWYLKDDSEYKPKDIENVIAADMVAEDYEEEKEEVVETGINYSQLFKLLGGIVLIILIFVLFRRYKTNKLLDEIEREEGAKKRGNKTTYSEDEDYERMRDIMNEGFEDEELSEKSSEDVVESQEQVYEENDLSEENIIPEYEGDNEFETYEDEYEDDDVYEYEEDDYEYEEDEVEEEKSFTDYNLDDIKVETDKNQFF